MVVIYFITFTLLLLSASDGLWLKKRFLFYNPADLSTALGYQNHQVHDLTSLVNEASGTAHGTGSGKSQTGKSPAGSYNVPNFPAMGQNPVQSQTGSLLSASGGSGSMVSGGQSGAGTPFSVSNGGGSASFPGTNQWRCDAHVVESCDAQCMDVDPKDGCPFCIPGCHTTSGAASSVGGKGSQSASQSQGQGTGGTQSGGLSQNSGALTGGTSQSGGLSQSPGMLSGGSSQSGSLGQTAGTLSGTAGQSSSNLGGNLLQQPSGLAGTGGNTQGTQGKQGTSGPAITAAGTNTLACPHFPSNCPKVYTALDKDGCLQCTILSSHTTMAPSSSTSLQSTSRTCAPKRCVPPCNKGLVLDFHGCPQCLCPSHV